MSQVVLVTNLVPKLSAMRQEGTRGYFAPRNNGIMDNEDLPPSLVASMLKIVPLHSPFIKM